MLLHFSMCVCGWLAQHMGLLHGLLQVSLIVLWGLIWLLGSGMGVPSQHMGTLHGLLQLCSCNAGCKVLWIWQRLVCGCGFGLL